MGKVPVNAKTGGANQPDDIVLVSADGGVTVEQCYRRSLSIAAKRGLVPVVPKKKAEPVAAKEEIKPEDDAPDIVRPQTAKKGKK